MHKGCWSCGPRPSLCLQMATDLGQRCWFCSQARSKSGGSWKLVLTTEARQCVVESDYRQGGPQRPLYEAVKVKPKLQRLQHVGDVRTVRHLLRKAAGIKWSQPKRKATCTLGRVGSLRPSQHCNNDLSCYPSLPRGFLSLLLKTHRFDHVIIQLRTSCPSSQNCFTPWTWIFFPTWSCQPCCSKFPHDPPL